MSLKKLTNINQLKKGQPFHHTTNDGKVTSYEFICIHPKNEGYILALNLFTQNGDKIYIPNLYKEEYWVGEYDNNFFTQKRIEYHQRMIKCLEERLNKNEKSC